MHHYVYFIENNLNGVGYVGIHSTKNLEDGYMGSGTLFKQALKEYHRLNFSREILFICDNEEEAIWLESLIVPQWLIDKWGKGKKFYNLVRGGRGGAGRANIFVPKITKKDRVVKTANWYYKKLYVLTATIQCVEDFIDMLTPINHLCIKCDSIWKQTPNMTLAEKGTCPHCQING